MLIYIFLLQTASLPISRVSPPHVSSSDSEASDSDANSAMLASCSLQEIRQEDLAAILPDQQDCDAFGGFEYESRPEKGVTDVGDASGSDMELPTQLVNAAIQRVTESSSETESQPATYASTLLQQFVQQQQLLNNTTPSNVLPNSETTEQQSNATPADNSDETKNEIIKRKRGRPRKNVGKGEANSETNQNSNLLNTEYCAEPNVSPDSGIQNSPDHPSSPEPTLPTNNKNKTEALDTKTKSSDYQKTKNDKSTKINKVNSTKKVESTKVQNTEKVNNKSESTKVVQKQNALSCNLDRVLYVNTDRVLYPPRRKAGRPAVKVGIRKPGRPPKYNNNTVNEAETENVAPQKNRNVQNAKANQSESKKVQNTSNSNVKSVKEESSKKSKKSSNRALCDNEIVQLTTNTLSLSLGKTQTKKGEEKSVSSKNKSGAILNEICERVSKRLELNNQQQNVKPLDENHPKCCSNNTKNQKVVHNVKNHKNINYIKNKIKLNALKSKFATLKHLKVMHTKHKHKKHKKHKIKILKTISMPLSTPKVDTDIDKLVLDFMKLCNLGTNKSQKENLPEVFRCVKRVSKKRKGVETNEGRKKKKQCNTSSSENKETNSNEQRLPLKKRHYHVSTSEQKHSTNETNIETPIVKVETTPNDIKTPVTKNGAVNTNKNSVITKNVTEKTKPAISNKSDVNTVENKVEPKIVTPNTTTENKNDTYEYKDLPDSEDIVASHIDEAIEACINRYTLPIKVETNVPQTTTPENTTKTEIKTPAFGNSVTATTPKKRHRLEENKIEQVEKITKKLDTTINSSPTEKSEKVSVIESTKNSLETVVTELKNKKNLITQIDTTKKPDKNVETIAQMITRKKNRLEDLTSNLVSKISDATEASNTDQKKLEKKSKEEKTVVVPNRASVIKSPVAKKIKPVPNEILDSVVNEKPTGIFLPSVDLELHIPASTIQTTNSGKSTEKPQENQHNLRKKKPVTEETTEATENKTNIKKMKPIKEAVVQIEKIPIPNNKPVQVKEPTIKDEKESTPVPANNAIVNNVIKKKMRRRKAINRTGFPTLKKKKKKLIPANKIPKIEKEEQSTDADNNVYDRVPRLDEEASTFMKRQQDCLLSVVSLEKLQAKPDSIPPVDDSDVVSKWEVSSECDSLPMDECIYQNDLDTKSVKTERSSSRLDIKDRMTLRARDVSPATSVETRSSDRTKKASRLDITDIKHRDSSTGSVRTSSDISEIDKKIKRKRDISNEKLSKKMKKYKEDCEKSILYKKRLRDLSPTSSIEPLPLDKRLRSEDAASGSDDSKKNKKIPRWRKKFLVAGLFSDYYKEDDESIKAKRRESASNKNKLVYIPEEHPYGLLPPPYHCGKYLRCRKVPFQLPHDLWWQHTHSQLPGRDLVPSWNYRKIRTNVYCVRAPPSICEPQACNCSGECGEDCINRLVLAECPPSHRCRNQKIQRHEWAPGLEKFMTDSKGWGVRTKQPIKKGEFILEYVGEVVSDQEFKQRMSTLYTHDTHHYCLHLDGGLVIDGHRMGGDGRFVNHSCQPNCEMQKWSVNGQFRMALFALRDIHPNEELTYDYNFSLFNPADGQVCKCGSNNCRGVIGGKSQRVKQFNNQKDEANNNHQAGRVGRPRKNQARRTTGGQKETPAQPAPPPIIPIPAVRPLSHQQKVFALEHHCFLLRNLSKVIAFFIYFEIVNGLECFKRNNKNICV